MGLLMLVTSGDYSQFDLTKPETLVPKPDNLAIICAIYWFLVWLWTMELLHYISTFVVVYMAEVWFFKHYGKGSRGSLCTMCGPALMLKAFCIACTKHLGSLIYAAILMCLLRVVRWVAIALLEVQQAADSNPVTACLFKAVKCCTDCFTACVEKVLNLTNQLAIMQIAWKGEDGYCSAGEIALRELFGNMAAWTAVEGFANFFTFLGVAGISAATGFLTLMITSTFSRYKQPGSANYVSDPQNMAIASAIIAFLMSCTVLVHFVIITDTMAFCRFVQVADAKKAGEGADENGSHCWTCWQRSDPRETERLLKK